jgi:hypothetical protein
MSTIDQQPGEPQDPPQEPERGGSVLAKMATAGFALAPTNFAEAYKIAQMLSQSAFVPAMYRGKPNDCLAAMAFGQEVGLSPLQALQGVLVINGRPSLWGDSLLGVIRSNASVLSVSESITGEGEEIVATCTIRRKRGVLNGNVEVEETTRTFSVADAKAAKLWGKKGKDGQDTPWITYPKRMLQMRARSWAIRDSCADISKGIAMAEEQFDAEPMRNVTPVERERDEVEDRIDALAKDLGWKRAQTELERKNFATRELFVTFLETEIEAKKGRPARGKATAEPTTIESAPTPDELLLSKDQLSMLMAFLGALEIGAPNLLIPVKEREEESRNERLAWAEQNGVVVPTDEKKGRQSFSMLTELQATKLIDVAKKDAVARGLVNVTMLDCPACGVKPDFIHKKDCPESGVDG